MATTATVIDEVTVPSIMLSSAPVTVTVCGVSQFAGVNVSVPVVDTSVVSFGVTVMTTSVSYTHLRAHET